MVRKDAHGSAPSARYQRLSQDDDGFVDAQFKVLYFILLYIFGTIADLAYVSGIRCLLELQHCADRGSHTYDCHNICKISCEVNIAVIQPLHQSMSGLPQQDCISRL